jgi:hypothetical protein
VPQFIEVSYRKRVCTARPDVVTSVEERCRPEEAAKEAGREREGVARRRVRVRASYGVVP